MLVASPPKVGKSWLMLAVARALTLKESVFGLDKFSVPEQARVLYMDQEVSPARLKDRVVAAFTPPEIAAFADTFYACSRHPDMTFSSDQGFALIENEVAVVRPDVLILDPIANMHEGDENSAEDIGRLFTRLEALRYLGRSWGLAIIVVHHTRKPPADDSNYDGLSSRVIRGSSKFISMPDSILMLEKGKMLDTPHSAWVIHAKFSDLRHTEDLDDFFLEVNRDGDMRVKFTRFSTSPLVTSGVPRMVKGTPPKSPNPFEESSAAPNFSDGPKVRLFDDMVKH